MLTSSPARALPQLLAQRLLIAVVALALTVSLAAFGPAPQAQAAPSAPAVTPGASAVPGVTPMARKKKKARKKRNSRAARVGRATNIAVRQIGAPYRYGGTGPGSFDCSGLIYFSFRRAGVPVPRTSSQQSRAVRRVAKGNLRRGDLMFFHNGGRVYHAAIFLKRKNGRIKMLHSPRPGSRVHRSTPWTTRWYGGTLRG